MTTTFIPIARHPQQRETRHHAHQSAPTKLPGLDLRQPRHQALRRERIQERQYAFQHQVKCKSTAEITRQFTPADVHRGRRVSAAAEVV
jgi:hypothetical protein